MNTDPIEQRHYSKVPQLIRPRYVLCLLLTTLIASMVSLDKRALSAAGPTAAENRTDVTSGTDADTSSNLGHYVIGPYEFFAEERTKAQLSNDDNRSRIFILPTLTLIPWETLIFKDGDPVLEREEIVSEPTQAAKATGLGLSLGRVELVDDRRTAANRSAVSVKISPQPTPVPAVSPSYLGRVVVNLTASEITPFAKKLILSQLRNKKLSELAGWYRVHGFYGDFYRQIPSELDVALEGYRFEVTAPRTVLVRVLCNGKDRGIAQFSANAIMSTTSSIGIDCPGLDASTARLLYDGHFSVIADMQIPLTRMQFAMGRYDLRNFNRIVAQQFLKRETSVKEENHGFLFWSDCQRSVSTFLTMQANLTASASLNTNIFVSTRDLDDPAIKDAAMNFIFPSRSATIDDVRKIINDHVTAAAEAEKNNQKEAAEAHRKYAEYLTSLLTSKGNDKLADQALGALSQLAGSAQEGADNGAAAAGAASGNPYLAIATFLVKGIAWKDSSSADTFQMSSLRTADWSESQTRIFNAIIANQITASYTVTQSDFPEYREFVSTRSRMSEEKGTAPTIQDVTKNLRDQAQQQWASELQSIQAK